MMKSSLLLLLLAAAPLAAAQADPAYHLARSVAVDAGSGHGCASNGRTDQVVMFELDSLAVLARIPAGPPSSRTALKCWRSNPETGPR